MVRAVSATEARVHLGELMREVVEEGHPVVVEKAGKPAVVLLSFEEYERMRAAQNKTRWEETLGRLNLVKAQIRSRRKGEPLPAPEQIIAEARKERDGQATGLR